MCTPIGKHSRSSRERGLRLRNQMSKTRPKKRLKNDQKQHNYLITNHYQMAKKPSNL
nr:MAG TPA: hypothetical protein [Caudoviricetes sp.]